MAVRKGACSCDCRSAALAVLEASVLDKQPSQHSLCPSWASPVRNPKYFLLSHRISFAGSIIRFGLCILALGTGQQDLLSCSIACVILLHQKSKASVEQKSPSYATLCRGISSCRSSNDEAECLTRIFIQLSWYCPWCHGPNNWAGHCTSLQSAVGSDVLSDRVCAQSLTPEVVVAMLAADAMPPQRQPLRQMN